MQIQRLVREVYRGAVRSKDRQIIAQAAADQAPGPLRRALERTAAAQASPQERQWLEAVAELRVRMDACDEPIEVLDFGAGSPQSRRPEEEMARGVPVRMSVAECSRASKDDLWGLLLFMLVREFGCARGLELGTNLGVSASYQAAAMQLNGGGTLTTCEGAPQLAELSRRNIAGLGLDNARVVTGKFTDTLPEICERDGPFDYVFIDGHHDEAATLAYFRQILPHTEPGALFVFDDIEWSAGMRSAWNSLERDPSFARAVGLHQLGICLRQAVSSPEDAPAVTAL